MVGADVIRYVLGVSLIAGVAILLVGTGLAHGLLFGNQLMGRKTTLLLFPKKEHWQDQQLFMIPFFGLWIPILNLFVLSDLSRGALGLPLSLSVLGGFIIGVSGVTTIGWRGICAAAVAIVPATWFFLFSRHIPVEPTLQVAYLFAGAIVGWNSIRAVNRAVFTPDEIVEDPAGAGASEKTVFGLALLSEDGQLIKDQPRLSVLNQVTGFVKGSLSFNAHVRPEGLYLRIRANWNGTPESPTQFVNPIPRKAVWVLMPWDHLREIAYDKIIGHRQIRLRLKNSGEELVLESPPRDIKKYLNPPQSAKLL